MVVVANQHVNARKVHAAAMVSAVVMETAVVGMSAIAAEDVLLIMAVPKN